MSYNNDITLFVRSEFSVLAALEAPDHLWLVSDECLGELGAEHDACRPVAVQAPHVAEPVNHHARAKPGYCHNVQKPVLEELTC